MFIPYFCFLSKTRGLFLADIWSEPFDTIHIESNADVVTLLINIFKMHHVKCGFLFHTSVGLFTY